MLVSSSGKNGKKRGRYRGEEGRNERGGERLFRSVVCGCDWVCVSRKKCVFHGLHSVAR